MHDFTAKKRSIVIYSFIGNMLEWYDFSLYGYFAAVISELFFPADSQFIALIKTFSIFAVGFLMRPIGAVLFGHFGDRYGRKKTLTTSVILMALSTVMMGLLPTHAEIGVWAGVFLTLCRLLQGLVIGGEFSGSVIYVIEHISPKKRGVFGSLANFSAFAGLLLGSTIGAMTTQLTDGTVYAPFAWRLPFIFGIVLGAIGLYLRLHMPETPHFIDLQNKKQIAKHPLLTTLREHPLDILKATLLGFLPSLGFYTCFVYLSSYVSLYLKLSHSVALIANTMGMIVILITLPWFGYLSDSVGRKPILMAGAITMIMIAYPLFLLIGHGTWMALLIAQIVFAIPISLCCAVTPTVLVEMFPTRLRYTAMSFPQNLANMAFGGTAPLVVTYLIQKTGSIVAPSFYLTLAGVVTLLAIFCIKETHQDSLYSK